MPGVACDAVPEDHFLELDGTTLTYEQFRRDCLQPNRPAIIRNACAPRGGDFFFHLPTLQHALDPTTLVDVFGREHQVPVHTVPNVHCSGASRAAPCSVSPDDDDDAVAGGCEERSLGSVLDAWCGQWQGGQCTESLWYLKDWHFQRDREHTQRKQTGASSEEALLRCSDGDLYRVPHFLGPDWMDPFCQVDFDEATKGSARRGFGNGRSDYRFVYMGVPNTWTGLHHDVFGTYSWSLNVCGDKLWFFPTCAGNKFLRETFVRGFPTPPDIRALTGFELDAFVQHPGDLVFVPSLFFHQVHNLTGTEFAVPVAEADVRACPSLHSKTTPLTISVNHNWCNHFCVDAMMNLLTESARGLAAMVSAEDLAAVFDLVGHEACVAKLDDMLHAGSNWSLAAGVAFLSFCRDRLELGAAEDQTLCFDEGERPAALALTERLLEALDDCKSSLYPSFCAPNAVA